MVAYLLPGDTLYPTSVGIPYFVLNFRISINKILSIVHGFVNNHTLAKECDEFRLLLGESLLILCDDPPLNRYVKKNRYFFLNRIKSF